MALHLTVSDLNIHLTRKERMLLRLLADNPGRCFSRKQLLTSIWGYSEDARSRTVDVHIRRLRKKLEAAVRREPDAAYHQCV
ncbi:MAG: winged helix-turn-helix transcriptional regulator [Acidimicrobiia bacterium]|nr:winged helix-turn-helix transcriptional regulator [Acidimicrobiia bacterium]